MSASSTDWEDPDFEEFQKTGTLTAPDRASQSLQSPNFQSAKPDASVADAAAAAKAIPDTGGAANGRGQMADGTASGEAAPQPVRVGNVADSIQPVQPADAPAPVAEPTILHQTQVDPAAEQAQQVHDQQLAKQQQAQDQRDADEQARAAAHAAVVAERARTQKISDINTSDAYLGDDGRWKKQKADPNSGEVVEHDVLGSGMVHTTNQSTGEMFVRKGDGTLQSIGVDQHVVDRQKVLAQRRSKTEQDQADDVLLGDYQQQAQEARAGLKVYGKTPDFLSKQLERLNAAPGDAAAEAAKSRLQGQLEDWKKQNPDYEPQKAALDEATQQIEAARLRKRDRQTAVLSAMADPVAARLLSLRPTALDPSTPPVPDQNGDVDGRRLDVFSRTVASREKSTPTLALLDTLAQLKAGGAKTVSGLPIDEQIAKATPVAPPPMAVLVKSKEFSALDGAGQSDALKRWQDEGVKFGKSTDPKFDEAKYRAQNPVPEGLLGSFLRPLASSIFPSVATAAAGTAAGIGAAGLLSETGPGAIAGGIAADIAMGTAAGAGARALQDKLMGADRVAANKAQMAANAETHSFASKVGEMIGTLPAFFGAAGAGKGIVQRVTSAAVGGGRMGGSEAAQQKVEADTGSGIPDTGQISIPAAILKGALTMGPTGLLPAAGSILKAIGVNAPSQALIQATSTGLYEKVVEGKEFDPLKVGKQAAVDAPAFAILEALSHGMAHLATPKDAAGEPVTPSTEYTKTLAKLAEADAKASTARENGDVAGAAALDEEAGRHLATAHEIAQQAVQAVPANQRAAIAKYVDPAGDFEANEQRLAEDPTVHFASAEIGRAVRGEPDPRNEAVAANVAKLTPDRPGLAQFIGDQHAGLGAVRDLTKLLRDEPIDGQRAQTLEGLGLVSGEEQDGAPVYRVTDDALPFLPRLLREQIKAQPEKYPIVATPGETGDVLGQLAKSGRQRLADALTPAGKAGKNDELGILNSELGAEGAERSTSNVQRPTSNEGAGAVRQVHVGQVRFTDASGVSQVKPFKVVAGSKEEAVGILKAEAAARGARVAGLQFTGAENVVDGGGAGESALSHEPAATHAAEGAAAVAGDEGDISRGDSGGGEPTAAATGEGDGAGLGVASGSGEADGGGSAGIEADRGGVSGGDAGAGDAGGSAGAAGRSEPVAPSAELSAVNAADTQRVATALAKHRIVLKVEGPDKRGPWCTPLATGEIEFHWSPEADAEHPEYQNAALDEELRHLGAYLALREDWMREGQPGTFDKYVKQRGREMYDDLRTRIESLNGADKETLEKAVVDSYELYRANLHHDLPKAKTAGEVFGILHAAGSLNLRYDGSAFLQEFARQLSQARADKKITEETHSVFQALAQWVHDAIRALRALAKSLLRESGPLEGTQVKGLVERMDGQVKTLEEAITGKGGDDQGGGGGGGEPPVEPDEPAPPKPENMPLGEKPITEPPKEGTPTPPAPATEPPAKSLAEQIEDLKREIPTLEGKAAAVARKRIFELLKQQAAEGKKVESGELSVESSQDGPAATPTPDYASMTALERQRRRLQGETIPAMPDALAEQQGKSHPQISQKDAEAEDRARAQYEAEARAEHGGGMRTAHYELLDEIKRLGGLPAGSSPHYAEAAGEIGRVQDAMKARGKLSNRNQEKFSPVGLFRNNAQSLDRLRESLNEVGFGFETSYDLLNAVEERLRSGRPVYGVREEEQALHARETGAGTSNIEHPTSNVEGEENRRLSAEEVARWSKMVRVLRGIEETRGTLNPGQRAQLEHAERMLGQGTMLEAETKGEGTMAKTAVRPTFHGAAQGGSVETQDGMWDTRPAGGGVFREGEGQGALFARGADTGKRKADTGKNFESAPDEDSARPSPALGGAVHSREESGALASEGEASAGAQNDTGKRKAETGKQEGATVDEGAHLAATSERNETPAPTEAQKEAGNYKVGRVRLGGLDISVENPAGTVRRPEWPVLKSHYGYIRGTMGKDGDHIDTFIKPGTPLDYDGPVFVVNQLGADGQFDEHKAVIGARNVFEAAQLYRENYSGVKHRLIGDIATYPTVEAFREWATGAERRTAPARGIADTGKRIPESGEASGGEHRTSNIEHPTSKEAAPSAAELVQENVGLAVHLAGDYDNIPGVEHGDVVTVAKQALVRAAKAYDVERGNFAAYAGAAIRNALDTEFRKQVRYVGRNETSLDRPIPESGNRKADSGEESAKDRLPGTGAAEVTGPIEQAETARVLAEAVGKLPERPRTVLRGLLAGRTLEEIGAQDLDGMTKQGVAKLADNSRKAVRGILQREYGLSGVDADGVLYARLRTDREEDRNAGMPDEQRAAQPSGQPSPSGQEAEGFTTERDVVNPLLGTRHAYGVRAPNGELMGFSDVSEANARKNARRHWNDLQASAAAPARLIERLATATAGMPDVLKEAGKPLVFYRGTYGDKTGEVFADGTHFTTDQAYAAQYAKDERKVAPPSMQRAVLRMSRPLDLRGLEHATRQEVHDFLERNHLEVPSERETTDADYGKGFDMIQFAANLREPVRAAGFDGMLFPEGGTTAVIYRPEQIVDIDRLLSRNPGAIAGSGETGIQGESREMSGHEISRFGADVDSRRKPLAHQAFEVNASGSAVPPTENKQGDPSKTTGSDAPDESTAARAVNGNLFARGHQEDLIPKPFEPGPKGPHGGSNVAATLPRVKPARPVSLGHDRATAEEVGKMASDFLEEKPGKGWDSVVTRAQEKIARKDDLLSPENRLTTKLGITKKTVSDAATARLASELEAADAMAEGKWQMAKGNARAVGRGIRERIAQIQKAVTVLPEFTPFLRAINKHQAELQRAHAEAVALVEHLRDKVPEELARVGITNWRQAGGDREALEFWRDATTDPKLRAGYEAALKLTPEQQAIARSIDDFYKEKLALGLTEDMLAGGVENYASQIWVDPATGRPIPATGGKAFKQLFAFAQPRQFDNFFEGEQAAALAGKDGKPAFEPLTKDAAALLGIYSAEFNKVLASRELIKTLAETKASDGRRMVSPSAVARMLAVTEAGEPADVASGAFHLAKEEDTHDYEMPVNPVFQKWKFTVPRVDPQISPMDADGGSGDGLGRDLGLDVPADLSKADQQLMMGNLMVHPEVARHLKNVLGESAIRKWVNEPSEGVAGIAKEVARGLMKAQSFTKGMVFLGSPFHAIHLAKKAAGAWVNPFHVGGPIDFATPIVRRAAEHGLMLGGDRLGQAQFIEGVGSAPWAARIPVLGPALNKFTEVTFHEYIPRLKLKAYVAILQRKMAAEAGALKSGAVTIDQLEARTAYEVNNTFGHLNYAAMGRNPTVQHVLSLTLLAPDFTEATLRGFSGALHLTRANAARTGLLTLAVGTFVAAKALNALLDPDGDAHLDHPFSVVLGNREYWLRSPVTDLQSMYKDWGAYVSARFSPLLNAFLEAKNKKNWRGEEMGLTDIARDVATQWIPMTAKGLPGIGQLGATDARNPIKGWEQFISSLGLRAARYSPMNEVHKWANEFQGAGGRQQVFPPSKYLNLKYALLDGKTDEAKAEWQKLTAGLDPLAVDKLAKGFRSSLFHPVLADDVQRGRFVGSLSESQRKVYDKAMGERGRVWERFREVSGTGLAQPLGKD